MKIKEGPIAGAMIMAIANRFWREPRENTINNLFVIFTS